ncbi:MAG: hypothetical protein QW112_03845 [Candidatus Micrarchaeia archaeon]
MNLQKISQKDKEKIFKQEKKDSHIFIRLMSIVHPIFLNEPYEKAISKLSHRTNIDSLIRIAKDRWVSPHKEEGLSARKLAIRILSDMNEKRGDEKIIAALLELAEDENKEISILAANGLPAGIKEKRIEVLMKELEEEEDGTKRLIIFAKLYPFMDKEVADRVLQICEEKEDVVIGMEVLRFLERLMIN